MSEWESEGGEVWKVSGGVSGEEWGVSGRVRVGRCGG